MASEKSNCKSCNAVFDKRHGDCPVCGCRNVIELGLPEPRYTAAQVAAAIAGELDPDESDTDYYLLFCDTCGVAAEHVLVEDEWQCCGPAHPR